MNRCWKIGTDCSGIDSPIQALQQLKIPFEHKWSCEIDPFAQKTILANYSPELLLSDMKNRDHSLLPDCDIYVAGFPCQSFSNIGKKLGRKDKRSSIMFECVKTIEEKLPKIFILENVKNLISIQKGKIFDLLMNLLEEISDKDGDSIYNLYAGIYDTKDYGIPQHRERLYVIGIRKDVETKPFVPPKPIKMKCLDSFLENEKGKDIPCDTVSSYIKMIQQKYGKNAPRRNFVIATAGFGNFMEDICPTLTCHTYFYLTKYKRYLSAQEMMRLQGFPKSFKQVVSDVHWRKQAGNTMSVNVLKALFREIFECIE